MYSTKRLTLRLAVEALFPSLRRYGFLFYIVPLLVCVKAESGRYGSEKTDYRYREANDIGGLIPQFSLLGAMQGTIPAYTRRSMRRR
jgi:hypothetical protein